MDSLHVAFPFANLYKILHAYQELFTCTDWAQISTTYMYVQSTVLISFSTGLVFNLTAQMCDKILKYGKVSSNNYVTGHCASWENYIQQIWIDARMQFDDSGIDLLGTCTCIYIMSRHTNCFYSLWIGKKVPSCKRIKCISYKFLMYAHVHILINWLLQITMI